MLRLLGRILLAIAAGLLIYTGVTGIMAAVKTIEGLGGWGQMTKDGYWPAIGSLIVGGGNIILALPAAYGFIRGKCGFWMFIFAAILGVNVGYQIYSRVQAGAFPDALSVWNFVLSMITPICYALGTVFILLRRRGSD